MTHTMTKGERQELRTVVRQRMKVLRADVAARVAELVADLATQVDDRFHDEDARQNAIRDRVADVIGVCEREVTDMVKEEEVGVSIARPVRLGFYNPPGGLTWPDDGRDIMRRDGMKAIEERRRKALLAIDRQEADLLQRLALDALESEAARAFLGSIPTVGELVPAFRLAELEAG